MAITRTPTKYPKLPRRLKPFFWEYRFSTLSWRKDWDLVTARILEAGDLPALRWLRRRLGDDALREWLLRREGRGLSRKQIRFWQLILDIPRRVADAWLANPCRRVWDERCHE